MSDFSLDFNQRDFKLLLGKLSKRIENNIKAVLRNEALPHLVDLIMLGFDKLVDRAAMLPEDPTNPANWREEFKTSLLEDAYQNFIVTGTRIEVHIGEKKFLGYSEGGGNNEPDDDTPLVWMVYYLEGLAGDWGFVSPELYERFRTNSKYESTWGRFGKGFMISREQFEAEGWDSVTTFDQIRHPFSGFSPLDIFTEALNEFKLRPFISKAIAAAVKGRKL